MANDNKRKLYDALSQDYDMGSYEQFCADLNDEGKRRKLYDATSQDYDLGTWDSFSRQLGYSQATTSAPASSPAPTAAPEQPKATSYFKLRRGGKDFTVSTDEVNLYGGLYDWAKAHPGAPLRVYMSGTNENGKPFDGHVDLSVAHDRREKRGYKYTTTSQAIEDKPWQPTEQEKIAMSHQLHQMQARTDAAFAETRERMENVSEYYRGNRGLGFHTVEGKPVFNLETGKMEKTYLTPTGDRTTSKTDADMATFQFRQAMAAADMSVGAQIRRAEAELAQLRKQYEESKSRVHGEWAEDYEKNDAPLAAVLAANTYVPRQTGDKENSTLRVAIRQKEEQLKNLQEERDRQIGKDVGFWRGFGRTFSDVRTWDFGTGDLLDAMTMLNADKYSAPDATEGEKRAGQEMLKAIYDNQQVEEMYGGNASFWNRAGVMTGYMPSFMLDFALTGGGYEVLDVAGKAAARGSVKLIGEAAIKEMTELGVKAYAKKYGIRGVGRMAENWTIKALGTTADDLLIRAPLMTNTVQAGKTTADIIDRKLGNVVVDANGNYDFSNDETWGSAIWQGEANAIIENYSEMFGAHLDGVVPALAKTFGGKRISGMLARANASSYGQILSTTRKQFERLGVSDYFGEVSEEYYGQLWRTMLNLDDAYTNVPVYDEQGNQVLDEQGNPVYERKNLLFTGQFHGDIWGGMALSMGLMGAGKYTISGIAYGNLKHQVNVADRMAAEIFTPERWEPIREIIDNTTNDDMGALAESMVNDPNLSDEERAAVMGYMERSLNLRGLNLGAMAQSRGAEDEEAVGLPMPVEIDSELSQSYIDGYEASTPQEMNDAQNMYEYQRQRAEGMFEPSMLDLLDTNPVDALMDIARNGLYSQEEIDAARDYVNAKTVRDGILQRVHDNIDEQIAQSDAMIDARVNPASGMIQPAIMGLDDRQVYIVGGTLAINEDGTIDREASDESIVVRDAQTGELQFTDPKSIVSAGEAIDPEMEKAIAVDNIRQQAAQAAADAMNGTLAFNPGDVVEINDGGGLIQVTVLGPLVDEESGMPIEGQVMVQFPNGQQTAFAKEQLQSFADAANLERLNNFEQERAAARTQQQATEAEAMRPQFALNDEFTILNDTGTPIRGSVTGELDDDGTVEIYTEEPINGNRVNRFTPAELEDMFDTYNGEPVATTVTVPENADNVPNPTENPEIDAENSENPTETVPNPEETATEPQQSALSRIPVDEQGQPKYDEADPETAWDAIVEQAQGDEAIAAEVVADIVADREEDFNAAEKAYNTTKEGKPEKRKKGDPAPTMAERIAAKNAAKEALAEAKAIRDAAKAALDHWKKIADKAEVDESTPENPVSATDYTIDTYTTKKNKTYHRVVFPRADKEVWQERLNLAKKMGGTSVPKGYGFKTREEAEAFAKAVANPETVAEAQPLSLGDMRGSIIEEPTTTSSTDAEQPSETATQPEIDKPVNPSGNKLVTDERYAELRERMRKKLGGQLNMGVDPEILAIGTEMAVYHIEKGARKFKAYASAMIADLGDAIRPYLKAFYNAVRDMPEAEAAGLVADMDSYEEVKSIDIANFDKANTDAMATAAAVVAEQEAEKQREEAEKKLKEQRKKRLNPDGSTTETVVENGTEIEITTGDFIPGVRPAVVEAEKKPGKEKSKPVTDGGLFDTIEDEASNAPSITVPEPRPAADLIGDSSAYQDRGAQTAELVEEIGGVIESRVMMLQLDAESVKPLTMTEVKKMASKYSALKDISDTDLQELVELAMTQLTRSEAIINIDGTAEQQRAAFDHIVNLYQIQPSLNARDSERLIKQQYSTPTPFGYVMGQFVRAGGKTVGSMLEPSAGNGALTITVHPSLVHVNDIDEARLANLRKLGYAQVTAQDALLPFDGDKVDVVMTNPPFGTVTEKVYDGIFHVSSLEGQMAINALEKMKDDGRAAIVIGGNTSYRTNGSMNPKDAAFFGYLYSHYNVADVINISGKALYSRNGTGYDVRMILIDGRKTGEFQRVFPPVKAKARAEQVTTFDELYKRVQYDIQQIQQVGSQPADVQREPETTTDGTTSAPIRSRSNRPNSGAGQRPGTTSDAVRDTPRTDSGQSATVDDGSSPVGVDNAVSGDAGSSDNVPQPKPQQPRSVGSGSAQNGTGRSGSDGRGAATSRPDSGTERLAVKPDLTTEKVPYPNQSGNGFTLMSVVPAAQAQVLQKSLGEIGDVDQYLVDELGYSSKEELYDYLAAEQIDSVALAIHQMNKGNAFIIGDMTGVGKGRQGAALIRYAVKQGKVPIYFTQKPTLFTDNYRDLADIGSSDLRPFIIASNPKDANIVDADGNIVHKLPSKKEQERVFAYIMEHGTLPDEYDYVLTTYDQIKNGTADYTQNEDGTWNTEARKLPKKSKGYTTADYNGQTRRDALAKLAEGNIAILDESHTVGGDSGCGRYMQMLTSSAGGVTFLSATFAKRADNMPIYAQRTAIAEAEVKASELIDAIMKGGVTLQEIMSKQLVESGQMIRRERSFEGVTIDWLSVEEGTDRRQREQFDEVAAIFNAIRNFQDDYITPIIDAKNEAAAEWGATVGHTQGTKDMGVKNVPFASKMYNLVNQLLFALKVDAVADRVVENLRNGYKPVISFTNTMEGFLSSAPKGVAMDEVPNFSLTLMRALDGVMRFTEKDADENTEGGSISLSELSAEGQKAYNAIRDKIMNLAADLPISPMDAIRMKIEEAGYSVAEITGRTMQLNRTADGKYIVEARKDRDKKAAMRDFNSGKLDVLMINKSGSTGISLHASSKFEDQRQRVMVFAQFQSDINDEVQMRGRIDRSGQVTRGRYEYIMSTIPAEQRIQMMFKAKLKSLDANTTSSQKSKFNEMEIVDYLNKYGDEVVWEYMKEHPELEERLGDPLDMLQEKDSEDGPRTSEKEDTSKKTGCAGKISRYLAFLSVDEQDEIFKEITEAYRVKIQLLDDAGENDLEITTMPLHAETKRKQIWHEGVNPGSGNAFADNTYVEEVEVDVLKKPMKRDEIIEATRKLVGDKGIVTEYDQMRYGSKVGEVNWTRYAREKEAEISQFFQEKADDAVGKLREAGEARIAKAREKAVAAATKARGRGENNFTDAEIQSLADTVANEDREKEERKQDKRRSEIMGVKSRIQTLLNRLRAGSIYVVPQDLKQGTPEMFSQTFGTFVGFKFNKGYTLGSSTAIFATLDGRRKVELALSDSALSTIISATQIAYRYSPKEINAISMENWDSHVPTQTRQKRYIITGNLLQALVDTEKGDRTRGNLISFSTMDGETRQGILMGENFKLTDLRNSVPLSSRLEQIRKGQAVVSENGDAQISKELYDWRHRGEYELRVPKSKQRGGVYTMNPDLLKLVSGHNFTTKGNNMVGYVAEADIAKVVDMLSRAPFNLTVLQESQLSDVSADEAEDDVLCRPVTDKATLDRLNSEPTIKVYRAMQMIDGGLRPPMSGKVDGQWRDATEVGVWEEAEEHPEMADENGRFKLDKGNGKSIKAAYNPYIHTSRSPINDQFSSAWSRPELVTVEVEVPLSELTSEYHAEKAKDSVGEKEWKSGPIGRALAKIGQARRVILSRWSRIVRVVPVEEVADAYAQRLNAHGIEVPFNTVPPALRDALAERGVKIGKPEKGNAGKASLPAFEQWINEQERLRQGDGYGAYSDAEVSYANDPISKVMGKNRFSKKRQAEFAARERQRMVARIQELAERMHLDNVEILTDASQLEGKRATAKGFYNKRTGKITIVIPNNVSTIDAEQTLLHEAVAHYGLRQLFGEQFNSFLDNVYQSADESIRRKITEMAAKNGWDFRTATEEYLAGLAEDTNFNEARNYGGWWSQIKRLFLDMLEKIGFEGFRDKVGVILTDNELRYILWRSYQNLAEPGRYRSILGEAADITKQSELKVGNYAEHDIEAEYAAEGDLYRPGDFSPRDQVFARREYERMVSSGSYQFKEAVQDSMLGLKKLYQAILGKGTRIENVPGFENAYLFENRMSSMNAGEQHEYFQCYMQPLLKEIAKIAGADKRKRRELTDYLMAKHGLERNEYMRNEAAANGEETDRDFAGLIGLTGEADWQSAEATAQQWVDDYENAVDTTALWQAINDATKATLEKIYLSGIISKETYKKTLGMYQFYIPLRGWNETTSEEVYGYLTSKDGPLGGSIMKKAEGRESMADDPIATIGMMADDAIRQGNRNLMKQRFLNFILNHPSDAVSVHDIWLEYDDVADEWRPVFADVEATDTADEVAHKVEAFEQRMEALRNAEPDKYKKGREAQHIPYKVVKGNLREHQILIKRNGRTFVATINGNPRAAQALNGLTNPDVDQNGVVGNMLKAGTWINRQLSAFYTTRNPDFVVSNFFRDALYSNCMTWVKESPRYARRFHKNFGRVNPIVMRRLLGKWEKGKLNMSNRIEALFYQFMKNGGETGYTNVRDIEGHKRAVAAELKKQGSTGRRVWTALGMQLDLLNRSAENCARFAAFVTSREFGRNIDRAIYDAKEISVNFNKKGSGGKMVNANGQTVLGKAGSYLGGGGRLLYVFWNAGIQGFTNFGRQAKLHPAKFTAGATALFALGYVIPMLAQMLGGGDGDDDDKNAYYNLPEYIRRSNICFYAGEQWITIPLPIEYRAMYGMGELAHGVISGNERYTNAELGRQMAAQISQIMPLDMLEGGGGISPFIPSAAKPFTEAYIMNKSWTGLPVYKDTPFNKNDPEWTKAYASADKHLVAFAKWLNEVSGGDDFKKGSIDINPAKIEYLLNGTFGGMFTFPNKIKKTGETMFGDRDFEWRNMPIANRLIKSGDERTANRKLQNEYFKYLKEYEATGQLMRKYENADEDGIMGYAERINFLENSPEYARWEIFDEFKPDIDAYREDIAEETDKEERKKLEAEMYAIMRELVNALHDPEAYRNSEQQ